MKVVFDDLFHEVYATDPAARAGRMRSITDVLDTVEWVEYVRPVPATDEDLARAHTSDHIEDIKGDRHLYEVAALAAGGAITAAELAYDGEPAFALIRPPGHHASASSCWGFCFFNNMSVAIERLRAKKKLRTAFILDFDLHFGDGNVNILGAKKGIEIMNPGRSDRKGYIKDVTRRLEEAKGSDIIGVSAGFDEYEKDWGGNLKTEDYRTLGELVRRFSDEKCKGRRFALLEGGYYHADFGINVQAFLEGFKK
jgi:acetoin utilization deacetylase AcuC-like enzyme